ncbi:MAG: DoxX family membrane protein [Syntrophaceae bacterium]|nr:DoxX family membrane protein [Syntrophaceae bacterium]
MKRIFTSPVLALLFRLILGVTFLYSGIVKAADPVGFAQSIANYLILPDVMVNVSAILLPWIEIVAGGSLLLGVLTRGGALVSSVLLGIFTCALLISLIRGLDVACGCFSTSVEAGSITELYILRDIVFLGMGVHVLFYENGLASFRWLLQKIRTQPDP